MRTFVAFAALALFAAPAAAAAPDADEERYLIPAELTDPAMAETLGRMLGALTKVMLDLPVGELQAAVEGRPPSAADRNRTMRDLAGGGPDLERGIEREAVRAVPRLQAGMKAMASSLPAMAKALEEAAETMEGSLDRAAANLPQPGYPKR